MNRFVRWIEADTRRHGTFVWLCLLGLLAALLAVSGCAGGTVGGDDGGKPSETSSLDLAGKTACNEFAYWLAGDESRDSRAEIAAEVDDLARDSKSGALADKSELLAKPGVVNSNENWALASDAFAYECTVLGWTAADAK